MQKFKILLVIFLLLAGIVNLTLKKLSPGIPDKSKSPYFLVKGDDADIESMPLLSVEADVEIAGIIADVTIKQNYKNNGNKPIEAIYVFPASTRAAVYGMTMKIGRGCLKQ